MCCGLLENSGFFGIGKIVLSRYEKEFWYISMIWVVYFKIMEIKRISNRWICFIFF